MDTIWWILLAFVGWKVVSALFADRTPIPETSGNVHKITSAAEFDALLSSTSGVVVDFYADWCPPCRAIAPIFSKLADEHASKGKLAFAKVNVDHVKDIAGRYQVSAMPTFIPFVSGKPVGVVVEGLKGRGSVKVDGEGRVDRVMGADKVALEGVVKALAGE
ncbi:thioredoxin [Coniochaeta sp. 2T2.1]|nr:thioredoxin [Coniochaeta sp. 2T2.1]